MTLLRNMHLPSPSSVVLPYVKRCVSDTGNVAKIKAALTDQWQSVAELAKASGVPAWSAARILQRVGIRRWNEELRIFEFMEDK